MKKVKQDKFTYYSNFILVDIIRLIMAYMCCSKALIDYSDIIDKPDTINKSITDGEWKILDASRRTHEEIILNLWNNIPLEAYLLLFKQEEIDQWGEQIKNFKESGLDDNF